MAYNIIDRDYKNTDIDNKVTGAVCAVYCDSESDLPTSADIALENILPGSWAWLATERTYKTLSSEGAWL